MSYESGIKIMEAQYLYSLPKRPKLRSLLANQAYKGCLQKTHWRSSTSSRKVWWLDNGWSQGPQWGGWSTKQSPIRSRGTGFSHSMDSILSVQKQRLHKRRKRFYESSSSRRKNQKLFILTVHWNWENIVQDLSWNHRTSTPHRSDSQNLALLKEPYDE